MLDQDTKKRIDSARQILVGKIPDPKAQVEQITTALIYKFMDDMDRENEELGGKAKFLTGKLKQFSWGRLLSKELSGQERMLLYIDALTEFSKSEQVPELFRTIFKGTFLPYRDPETLNLFLKEINGFTYDNSEELGNAFEYLLSILGSQGDAGQFRTPRHIIDFIVEVVDPKKTDRILDPACGTAGFLISAYKHIKHQNSSNFNTGEYLPSFSKKAAQDVSLIEIQSNGNYTGDKLTPDNRKKLGQNIIGYDISPDMVRLSLVNMYLHGFNTPQIFEYDTLTYEDRWEDNFDIILANPPFMSPTGGIRPHKRFQIQANRSELLFVDYIAEHLALKGRAGVIVPEGIIFQSNNAYRRLREMLIQDNFLWAVLSLPAGVFRPYSGVKTSILFLDRERAKQNDEILFVKVSNDGYDLGDQRRAIDRNDLPPAFEILHSWQRGVKEDSDIALWVKKTAILKNEDHNLAGDRYVVVERKSKVTYKTVPLAEVCSVKKGTAITRKEVKEGSIPVIAGGQQFAYFHNKPNRLGNTITVSASGAYAGFVNYFREPIFASDCTTIESLDESKALTYFVYLVLRSKQEEIYKLQRGMGQPHVYPKDLQQFEIPVPPLNIQELLVKELSIFQRVIDSARTIVETWNPTISIDPSCKHVKLGDVIEFVSGVTLSIPDSQDDKGVPIISMNSIDANGDISHEGIRLVKLPRNKTINYCKEGDLLFNWRNGSKHLVGKTGYFEFAQPHVFASFLIGLRANRKHIEPRFLWYLLNNYRKEGKYLQFMRENVNGLFNREELRVLEIPCPSLEVQRKIVNENDVERNAVHSAKTLIKTQEMRIASRILRLWDE